LITECNAGFYCLDAKELSAALTKISNENAQGEYYLTDVIEVLTNEGKTVKALVTPISDECMGINTRAQLAEASGLLQQRINAYHMDEGVTMWDPSLVWIGPDVKIANAVEILPGVILMGETSIGSDTVIGPNTRLTDTQVGTGCRIDETVAIESRIDDDVTTGPRAYLRPGTHMCRGSKAGTHVEIKKSTIGINSKVPHLSYIGDTTMGRDVNVGAGSITCNYDGKKKHPTVIGDRAFIGSSTMMVAPVSIGPDTVIGAGSVIVRGVPKGALGLARADQLNIAGWVEKKQDGQD
ncbi:MAG: bifunctional UDP-N-acetylglucosamine diphosphorylase/glucosamine-1-phosphate N-acetyltransferase GlmU, partial [Eggerthellaceae bacterium]|nr:bifunctional UDP-N-acetylglucosamine diphosphorylase/glucosamine-1-phosphate N-acetyltransferase GlmU [Eggerthellaceae bacterium]